MVFYSIWLSTRYWYIFVYTKIFNLNYETLCVGIEIVFSGHPVTEIMKLVPGYVHWICLIDVIGSSFTVTSWLTPKKIFFRIPVLYRIKRWKSDTLYLRNKSSFIIHILYLWKKSNKIFTVIAYFADEIIVPILFVKINKIFITWYEKIIYKFLPDSNPTNISCCYKACCCKSHLYVKNLNSVDLQNLSIKWICCWTGCWYMSRWHKVWLP